MDHTIHEKCEDFQPQEMTSFESKFRDVAPCSNDGHHERCSQCKARTFASQAPPWKYGRKNYTNPI